MVSYTDKATTRTTIQINESNDKNCPVDYDETSNHDVTNSNDRMMIPQKNFVVSSQECVGNNTKMPPSTKLSLFSRNSVSEKQNKSMPSN